MYTYGGFMLRFDRKQNSVKQLSFNKKINLKNKATKKKRLLGEISITSDMQITPPLWQKAKRN